MKNIYFDTNPRKRVFRCYTALLYPEVLTKVYELNSIKNAYQEKPPQKHTAYSHGKNIKS